MACDDFGEPGQRRLLEDGTMERREAEMANMLRSVKGKRQRRKQGAGSGERGAD